MCMFIPKFLQNLASFWKTDFLKKKVYVSRWVNIIKLLTSTWIILMQKKKNEDWQYYLLLLC